MRGVVVINTHGWVQALGAYLLQSIQSILSASVLVQIGDDKIFETGTVCQVDGMKNSSVKFAVRSFFFVFRNGLLAADIRLWRTVAYFCLPRFDLVCLPTSLYAKLAIAMQTSTIASLMCSFTIRSPIFFYIYTASF